jgi:hypothetical protein
MTWPDDRRIYSTRASIAVLFLVALICTHGFAQGPQDKQAGRSTIVRLAPVRQMREDVDLWPLIVHPKSTAQRRINATLAHLNEEIAKKVRDCLSGEFAWSKGSFSGGEWQRTIRVTMTGPRFLSMVAGDGFYCGTAHPDDDMTVAVFDMETGSLVDWSTLVAKSAAASSAINPLQYEGGAVPLIMPELQVIYASAEEAYCKDNFEDERPFFLWPDVESGTLIAEVAGLPHDAAPCKNELKLTIEQARKLGFRRRAAASDRASSSHCGSRFKG